MYVIRFALVNIQTMIVKFCSINKNQLALAVPLYSYVNKWNLSDSRWSQSGFSIFFLQKSSTSAKNVMQIPTARYLKVFKRSIQVISAYIIYWISRISRSQGRTRTLTFILWSSGRTPFLKATVIQSIILWKKNHSIKNKTINTLRKISALLIKHMVLLYHYYYA